MKYKMKGHTLPGIKQKGGKVSVFKDMQYNNLGQQIPHQHDESVDDTTVAKPNAMKDPGKKASPMKDYKKGYYGA